jgi:hypothetical protein
MADLDEKPLFAKESLSKAQEDRFVSDIVKCGKGW